MTETNTNTPQATKVKIVRPVRTATPQHVQDWKQERAKAKRRRRAAKPDASAYARANGARG